MDKDELAIALKKEHQAFIEKLNALSEVDFIKKPGDKWTAGQQLDHILKSVKPVDMAFGLPLFVLKMKFGLANRPSKTYDKLVNKYKSTLEKRGGYKIPSVFAPTGIPFKKKDKALQKLQKTINKLSVRIARFSEKELDTYILPHPLLGKLTLREMLYFTIYHVQHHDGQILKNLGYGN